MAGASDTRSLDEVRRTQSLSPDKDAADSTTRQLLGNSSLSLEGLNAADIDAIVNKRWTLDEVIELVHSKLAILSGGRDKRGAPIITVTCNDHSNVGPINIGKLLSYLSKAVDEPLRGKGFTLILDMQKASWAVAKRLLTSLQITFVEHIHHVFVVKPRAFWQKRKVGVSFSMNKARYNFPVVMLDSASGLLQYLAAGQVTKELGGSLIYKHEEWIDAQRCLEKHVLELKDRLTGIESLREQLEQNEDPVNLDEARDAVRRHVEAKPLLDKGGLDAACDGAIHAVSKLKGCNHPDIIDFFNRIDELCGTLQSTRGSLQLLWDEKGINLDQVLQLRVFENDCGQLTRWVEHEASSLAREHTDIGESSSSAQRASHAFAEFNSRVKLKAQELNRVVVLGERLVTANHYAADEIKVQSAEVKSQWDGLMSLVEERESLFTLAIGFFDRQQKFFDNIEEWSDLCNIKDTPEDISSTEQAITTHKDLQEVFQSCYSISREEGHKIIEKLRKPVGESSVPHTFVARTRVVKEILESLFDEKNWLDEQWNRKNKILQQTLNLRKYQKEAKEVYKWLDEVGTPFLLANNTIGKNEAVTIQLLRAHDVFEKTATPIYTTASQLFTKATQLATSQECNPELIGRESSALEGVVNSFASGLDTRREIILKAQEIFKMVEQVLSLYKQLTLPIPRSQFISSDTSNLELEFSKYSTQHTLASTTAIDMHIRVHSLLHLLRDSAKVNGREDKPLDQEGEDQTTKIDYSEAAVYLETRIDGVRQEVGVSNKVCDQRERLWNLSIQFNQLEPDVEKHTLSLESWTREQVNWEWEPASNLIDAQLQLDAFQRQYNQFLTSHNDLVSKGRTVARELAELDHRMFEGSKEARTSERGWAEHSAVSSVEVWVKRLEGACERMKGIAGKKIEKLKSCLQFYTLQQKATELKSSLTSLSSSVSMVSGVGDTLEEAKKLNQQAIELNQKTLAVTREIEQYSSEVEDCVKNKYYKATSLRLLAKSLVEKKSSVTNVVADKLTLTTTAVEFHQNVQNLYSTMDKYHKQLQSESTIASQEEIDKLLQSSNQLHTFIQEAAKVVNSNGKNLGGLLIEHSSKLPQQKAFSLDDYSPIGSPLSSKRIRNQSNSVNEISANVDKKNGDLLQEINGLLRKEDRHKSWDILDSKHETIQEEQAIISSTDITLELDRGHSWDASNDKLSPQHTSRLPSDSPKLLVVPRKARASGIKSAKSMPSLGTSSKEQEIIDNLLENVSRRLSDFEDAWKERVKELEQLKEVIGYQDDVGKVVKWVETIGDLFLEKKNEFGRSIEEVTSLISECSSFAKKEVTPYSDLVNKLDQLYQSLAGARGSPKLLRADFASRKSYSVDVVETQAERSTSEPNGGHRSFSIALGGQSSIGGATTNPRVLLELRALHSSLENKWGAFDRDFKRYSTKLDLSLKFHEILFEASSWCQVSQQFLDKMEEKIDLVSSVPEANDLLEEVATHMSVTNDQQSARVEQLKHTSEFLHSSTFMDLTNQIARSTSRTLMEVEGLERNLRKMAARFTQIENEKDRERRLHTKRSHVLEELLQTEVSFVADLKLILKCRPRFMRADLLPNTLKGKEAIIFGNINEIEAFHRTALLPGLQKYTGLVEETASLFVDYADEMKTIYVPFCRDKSSSEELLASHRSYLNRVQSLFPTDTPLSTLLIKPVQRITKYPLLLKDLLKCTSELGESTSVLEEALKAVERIPVATNNALHLSYLENSSEVVKDLGELVYQSTLLISDSKFGIKGEKERQVFGFKKALLFARKVEVDRQKAKFKYELKSKLSISPSIQIVEFIEGEPCKFDLVTPDNRLHLKSSSVDIKQDWVQALRMNILETTAKLTSVGIENGNGLLNAVAKDLRNPSPHQSPVALRKSASEVINSIRSPEFDKVCELGIRRV